MAFERPEGMRYHGGPDAQGVPLHDFSSNSNGCGPCPAALAAVGRADASCYPDPSYAQLRQTLADFHGVTSARVVLAGSASEFIFRITALAALSAAQAVWLPPHSYGDYAQAALAHGLPVSADPALAQLLWACEPSSPVGSQQGGLLQVLAASRAQKSLLVLDRAYEPLRLSGAPTLDTAQLQQVWQLYTPNKALGLTGVRAAYAIAPHGSHAAVAGLEQLCHSWPLGAHGAAMLQAWTSDAVQNWLARNLTTLRGHKAQQIAMCQSWGWTCLLSDANFFCARPVLPAGIHLAQALANLRQHGIKLRDTTSFGLPGHVRLSVLGPDAQAALGNVWQKILESTP